MIEALKRFLRTTPQGGVDVATTIENLREPVSSNELNPIIYLESLSPEDNNHVRDFLGFIYNNFYYWGSGEVAVIAVGSTVRPEAQRHHSPEDIDLRILNTISPPKTKQRGVDYIKDTIRFYLQTKKIEFEEHKSTVENRMVPNSRNELVSYVDWYNTDPSFVAKYPSGLPLHISIAGVESWDIETYLRKERENNAHFTVLYSEAAVFAKE